MEFVKRLVRTINYKYVVAVVLIVALLYVLTLPVVIESLIAFLLAGVIPGTDTALSPDTMLLVLGILAGATLTALFVSWLVRWRRTAGLTQDEIIDQAVAFERSTESADKLSALQQLSARRAMRRAAHESALAAAPAAPVSKTAHLRRRTSTRAVDLPVYRALAMLAVTVAWGLMALLSALVTGFGLIGRILLFMIGLMLLTAKFLLVAMIEGAVEIGRLLGIGLRHGLKYGMWGTVFLIVVIGVAVDALVRFSKYGWRQARPYLEAFDSWLEMQYRKLESGAQRRAARSEAWQVIRILSRDIARSGRSILHKLAGGSGQERVKRDSYAEDSEYEQ